MARLGRRERGELREREAREHGTRLGNADRRAALTDLTPIHTSWQDPWPIGKASVKWGYNGGTAGRIHRQKG